MQNYNTKLQDKKFFFSEFYLWQIISFYVDLLRNFSISHDQYEELRNVNFSMARYHYW